MWDQDASRPWIAGELGRKKDTGYRLNLLSCLLHNLFPRLGVDQLPTPKSGNSYRLPGFHEGEHRGECEKMSAPFRKTQLAKDLFEPDTTITNEKLIPFVSLQTKWKGATLSEIEYIINTGELICFNRVKTIFENGEKVHYLQPSPTTIYYETFTNELIWDKRSVVFKSDIERIEKERPDFLCQRVFDNIEEDDDDDENSDSVFSSTENTDYQSVQKQTEAQESLQARISELEAALADSEAENARLRERLVERENTPQADGWDDIPYTLWREVLAMRERGMTDKQIAAKLYDKGQGMYQSQLGALLYIGKEKMPSGKTLQENGTKLFR